MQGVRAREGRRTLDGERKALSVRGGGLAVDPSSLLLFHVGCAAVGGGELDGGGGGDGLTGGPTDGGAVGRTAEGICPPQEVERESTG